MKTGTGLGWGPTLPPHYAPQQEYLGHGGDPRVCQLAAELALGADCAALRERRCVTVHGVSGTGCLRVRERRRAGLRH